MNIVPLSPITMVRPPAWPLDQSSTLKPDGSLILSSGSLSADGAIGGVGCGLRLPSCLLAAGFDLSIGLKPGWAESGPAAAIRNAKLPAAINPRRYDVESDMHSSPCCGSSYPFRPGSCPVSNGSSLAEIVEQMAPSAQAGSITSADRCKGYPVAPPQARRRGRRKAPPEIRCHGKH